MFHKYVSCLRICVDVIIREIKNKIIEKGIN